MRQHRQKSALYFLGVFLLALSSGCTTPQTLDTLLGKDIAAHRAQGQGQSCPAIIRFHASPTTVNCGGEVFLTLAALAPDAEEIYYHWEIEGENFDSGTHAVWKTPACTYFKDPQQLYSIRGVASDGECSVAQTRGVQVLCDCPLELKVNFAFGKADLDKTSIAILDILGSTLNNYPSYSISIEGHTDSIGTRASNQTLGKQRAEAVKNYLISRWRVRPERFITRSFGEESPVAPNDTNAGRAQNRRAEIFRIRLNRE
ncbi:hypothetical protein CSB45_03895 [candidate division KSB3 bacterium]|uniref:OmpA-like domain-containing protein n=1 Tax=candidate division KSB3 bacterium TaxID=2044937 RepID=A0A2G6E7Y7_9BACT|nr:MAG: hypothetical protein CSB45_03895 [candidate division KSB3 bacterium]PIE30523.1 MAG: hypothetical protein CSA57_02480 [candidate division KSB3 bacterium]